MGEGLESTFVIARFKCFFPMYPLGHKVSEISSMGITSALSEGVVVLESDRIKPTDIG